MTIQGNTTLLDVQRLYNREVRQHELVFYRKLLRQYGKSNKTTQRSHSYAINKLAHMSSLELDRGLSRALRLACFSNMPINKLCKTTVSDIIYSVILGDLKNTSLMRPRRNYTHCCICVYSLMNIYLR